MKHIKRILFVLFVVLILAGTGSYFYFKNKFMSAPPNELSVSNLGQPFDFIWRSENFNGIIEPHAYMFVPVTIPGIDRTFYMQFDTGTPSTILLYNQVLSINEKYGDVFQLDTVDNKLIVEDASLRVGTVDVNAKSMSFKGKGSKINWADSSAFIILGTVGNDFMEKNPLIIDYVNQKITLTENINEAVNPTAEFLPFTFEGRKIFLSAKLDNEPIDLWYDSGSSANELIVEEKTFLKMAKPGAKRRTYTGNSWGKKIEIHNIDSEGTFHFGNTTVPLTYVTYIDWHNKLQEFILKVSNIGGDLGGMTGNKLFLNNTLVLDAPNMRYAVLP